jgi:hypothetical protein
MVLSFSDHEHIWLRVEEHADNSSWTMKGLVRLQENRDSLMKQRETATSLDEAHFSA